MQFLKLNLNSNFFENVFYAKVLHFGYQTYVRDLSGRYVLVYTGGEKGDGGGRGGKMKREEAVIIANILSGLV